MDWTSGWEMVAALAGVLMAWTGLLIGAIRLLWMRSVADIERRLQLVEEASRYLQQLPLEYVRREDWVRFSATIESKIDRLQELLMEDRRK